MTTTETALNTKVHELLLDQIARGTQIGTQVCAYQNGEVIVDAWAGNMGPEDARPVGPDTLFSSFSTTKGVAATALHILADRGLIEYEQPVTKYWKDFGCNGKDKLTVAQAMSHQGGLHAMPATTEECLQLLDWETGLRYVECGTPGWEPGTATGYHAVTFGWVAGGIIQHATGRHISEVIANEIAAPLGIGQEMFVGIPVGERFRARFGNPYAVVHRADLHDALLDACRASGLVDLRVSSRVIRYDQDGSSVSVSLASGERIEGAALVGADGFFFSTGFATRCLAGFFWILAMGGLGG